jgi:phage terminase large subunit-like protein
LNIEIGLALQSDRWAGADHWEAAADDDLDLDAILARSDAIVIGADGGGLDDLLGVAVLGRCASTRRWLLWAHAWAHASVFERRKDIAARLRDLAAAGDLSIVEQLGDDVEQLGDIFGQVNATGLLYQVGVDPAGVGAIVEAAAEAGVEADRIVGISQGWKLSGAIKTAERALADGTLRHCGQPLMAWCVGNAKVEPRGNALTITKQAAGSAKIDALMALFDAVALMSLNPATRSIDQGFVDLGGLAYAGD